MAKFNNLNVFKQLRYLRVFYFNLKFSSTYKNTLYIQTYIWCRIDWSWKQSELYGYVTIQGKDLHERNKRKYVVKRDFKSIVVVCSCKLDQTLQKVTTTLERVWSKYCIASLRHFPYTNVHLHFLYILEF